jgi:hypothetical protein
MHALGGASSGMTPAQRRAVAAPDFSAKPEVSLFFANENGLQTGFGWRNAR